MLCSLLMSSLFACKRMQAPVRHAGTAMRLRGGNKADFFSATKTRWQVPRVTERRSPSTRQLCESRSSSASDGNNASRPSRKKRPGWRLSGSMPTMMASPSESLTRGSRERCLHGHVGPHIIDAPGHCLLQLQRRQRR